MKWDDDKVWELLQMYEDPEVSVDQIAKHFGVSKTKIYYIANKNEIKRGTWIEQGYKKCPKCRCVLELKEFHKNKSVKCGVNGYCKECYREIKGTLKRKNIISKAEKTE